MSMLFRHLLFVSVVFFPSLRCDTCNQAFPITETCILASGERLLIENRNNCLQEDDPEILLLCKTFPMINYEDFISSGYHRLDAYIDFQNQTILCAIVLYVPHKQEKEVHVDFLAVDAAYQKKGIGKALMLCLEKTYACQGYTTVCLVPLQDSKTFYTKLGYAPRSNNPTTFEKKFIR